MDKRLVVGITGATGAVYGVRLLEVLAGAGVETHLVVSAAGEKTLKLETGKTIDDLRPLAAKVHAIGDIAAPIASGSFRAEGMAVCPCSMKTLSAIANCYAENLLVRAADVMLKEGRKLVLVPRETPLHLGHLRLLTLAAESGAVILPPMPAFYHEPKTISDLVDQTVGKVLDQFGINHELFRRWGD